MTIIETPRIILRQFIPTDYKAVYDFGSNAEVNKYTGDESVKDHERAKEIIASIYESDYEKQGYGRWAVVHKSDNKVIGFAGLKYLPEFDETDIGFRFLPEYWGKGIGTEVSKEIIKYGFEHLNLERIIGIAMPENIGSCRVLEKCGMTFYKMATYDDEDPHVYKWYEILKNRNQ